jgi:hypothetical protein
MAEWFSHVWRAVKHNCGKREFELFNDELRYVCSVHSSRYAFWLQMCIVEPPGLKFTTTLNIFISTECFVLVNVWYFRLKHTDEFGKFY